MNRKIKLFLVLVACLAVFGTLTSGCGKEETKEGTVVIGFMTDLSGPAASGLKYLNWALEDQVKQMNEDEAIPGVTFEIKTFDTKYDPSRALEGYDYLKSVGAQVIFNVEASSAEALKSKCERDKIPMFGLTATTALTDPPGWVFLAHSPTNYMTAVLAKYVGDEWTEDRKIKIGFLGWSTAENLAQQKGVKDYAEAHPELFEWVASCVAPQGTVQWAAEVETLKDCDYIYFSAAGVAPAIFCAEYRAKGYTATFLCADGSVTFLTLYISKAGWPAMDGTLTVNNWGWWTMDTPLVNSAKEALQAYHPDEAQAAMEMGIGYIGGFSQWRVGLDILTKAVKSVGVDEFDGTAFYNTAQKVDLKWDGYKEFGFSSDKRYVPDHANIWRWSAADEDLVQATDWLPIITD